MKSSIGYGIAIAATICAGSAHAASVSPDVGEVLVNKGQGFVVSAGSTAVSAGDQIMVRPGGAALIAYSDACTVRVGADRTWTVQPKAPCAEGSQFVDLTGKMGQGTDTGTPTPGIDMTTILIGGAVVGGGVAAAIALSDDDDDAPASAN